MPTDTLEVGNLFIVDQNTGERTELNGIASINITTDNIDEFEPIRSSGEINLSMDISEVSDEAMQILLGKHKVFTGSIKEITKQIINEILPHQVLWLDLKQNRTHKKKRINKKWAKRYGYTCTIFYE